MPVRNNFQTCAQCPLRDRSTFFKFPQQALCPQVMAQLTNDQSVVVNATLNFQVYQKYAYQFQERTITIGLLGGLYGTGVLR